MSASTCVLRSSSEEPESRWSGGTVQASSFRLPGPVLLSPSCIGQPLRSGDVVAVPSTEERRYLARWRTRRAFPRPDPSQCRYARGAACRNAVAPPELGTRVLSQVQGAWRRRYRFSTLRRRGGLGQSTTR